MKISINSNKPPVATIGLPAPGMRLALGFPAENSGLFLLILILEIINDEVFTNDDDDDINEVDDCVCASHQASASSSCRPCGTLRRTSWAKLVEAWGLVQTNRCLLISQVNEHKNRNKSELKGKI